MRVNIRDSMNFLSDVLVNRPAPLREFDQIYMKMGDVMVHVDHICTWFAGRRVVFIGDGDAVGLSIMHLAANKQIDFGPSEIHLLDFDERMVESVMRFAEAHDLKSRVKASWYNVRDPIPADLANHFDGFHTNPPFGKSNGGQSVQAFVRRGIEACKTDCRGCIVLADDDTLQWTQDVLFKVQDGLIRNNFMISEIKPKAHSYHLDDSPELTSCTLLVKRAAVAAEANPSKSLTRDECNNFYGKDTPLKVERIRDRTAAGAFPSRDYEVIPFPAENLLWESAK